jgi:hypothetical protein
MNRRILPVLILLMIVFSVGIPAASATKAALNVYKSLYTDGTCKTCHVDADPEASGITTLNDYGKAVNELGKKTYGKSFPDLTPDQKTDVLKRQGPAPGDKPIPELPTIVLFGVSLIGLFALVRYRRDK